MLRRNFLQAAIAAIAAPALPRDLERSLTPAMIASPYERADRMLRATSDFDTVLSWCLVDLGLAMPIALAVGMRGEEIATRVANPNEETIDLETILAVRHIGRLEGSKGVGVHDVSAIHVLRSPKLATDVRLGGILFMPDHSDATIYDVQRELVRSTEWTTVSA